jgi:hypothetical protein
MAAREWNDLLLALASVAGPLLGVALAVLHLTPHAWRDDGLRRPVALLAVVVLATPVFFSLIVLMPPHPWKLAGALVGLVGFGATANYVVQYVRFPGPVDAADVLQLWLVVVNVAAFGIMLAAPSLAWKAGTCIWMVLWGLVESWLVLRRPARAKGPDSPATRVL